MASAARVLPAIGTLHRGVTILEMRELRKGGPTLFVDKGSVAAFEGSAIVNAANVYGLGGAGIDGVLSRLGGKAFMQEREAVPEFKCSDPMSEFNGDKIRIPEGGAVMTGAGEEGETQLKCLKVIHTVGPQFSFDGDESKELFAWKEGVLANCYSESLALLDKVAKEKPAEVTVNADESVTIGFALVSAGIFRGTLSVPQVLEKGMNSIQKWANDDTNKDTKISEIHLVGFTEIECQALVDLIQKIQA